MRRRKHTGNIFIGLHDIITITQDTNLIINLKLQFKFAGIENWLCHSTHVRVLGVDGSSAGGDQSSPDRPLPADGRHGNQRSLRPIF